MSEVISSREDIFGDLDAESVDITEEVWIRGKQRFFKVKPFESTAELDAMSKKIKQICAAVSAAPGIPPYGNLTESEVNVAVIVSMATIEPKLSIEDVIKIQKKAGPPMMMLMGRIMEISGVTERRMKEEVEKLDADPFSPNGTGDMSGVFSQASEGNEVKSDGDNGVTSLQQDKEPGNKEG